MAHAGGHDGQAQRGKPAHCRRRDGLLPLGDCAEMKGWLRPVSAIAVACVLGIVCSELLCHSVSFRDLLGRVAGRGRLIAITHGRGFYENDLEVHGATAASDLIVAENLRRLSSEEKIDSARLDRELSLYRAEFGDESTFARALRSNRLSLASLREKIASQLR